MTTGRYTVVIDPDVADVLRRSDVAVHSVKLPDEHLDRGLYVRVDRVLRAAGGQWDRRTRTHRFTRDPREALGLALETGELRDDRKAMQQFFTPDWLADEMCVRAGIEPGNAVLEPSAGAGALALAARARGGEVFCVEIDSGLGFDLEELGFVTWSFDFLGLAPQPRFDRVVMNPPFAAGQAVEHVTHAFDWLRPGGRLVTVLPAGVKTRHTQRERAFLAFVDLFVGTFEDLPEGTFRDSGTDVRTVLLEVTR